MGKSFLSLRFIATALLTLTLLTVGGFNIQQKRIYVIPEDGCSWIQTSAGVQARAVVTGWAVSGGRGQRGRFPAGDQRSSRRDRRGCHEGALRTQACLNRHLQTEPGRLRILFNSSRHWSTPSATISGSGCIWRSSASIPCRRGFCFDQALSSAPRAAFLFCVPDFVRSVRLQLYREARHF